MKKRHERALGVYTRSLADMMGLRDWHFEIVTNGTVAEASFAKDDEEFHGVASCTPVPGAKRATIHFLPALKDLPPEELREIVVHELLHCHLAAMYEWGRTCLTEQLGQPAYNVFMYGFAQQWETAVDGIARPWAVTLPLIDWTIVGDDSEKD